MSLVGPRPLPQRDFDQLEEWHKKRYLVLPGITGLWQVAGRSELDFDDLVRLDFLYLERWSVGLDLAILLKTVPAVLQPARRVLSPCWSPRWRRRCWRRPGSRRATSPCRSRATAPGRRRERWSGARTSG